MVHARLASEPSSLAVSGPRIHLPGFSFVLPALSLLCRQNKIRRRQGVRFSAVPTDTCPQENPADICPPPAVTSDAFAAMRELAQRGFHYGSRGTRVARTLHRCLPTRPGCPRLVMPPPTYDLHPDASTSDDYYRDITELVDEVLEAGEPLRGLIGRYNRHQTQPGRQCDRSHEELLLELLMMGVLWIARGREAILLDPRQRGLVTELVRELRAGNAKRRDNSQNALLDFDAPLELNSIIPSVSDLEQLNDWLLAAGEYNDEVTRLDEWLRFLRKLEPNCREPLKRILAFANDFEVKADRKLGRYTTQVNAFLLEQLPRRRHREDAAQCSRRRVEYHLNLLGAELLNRAWRAEFSACEEQTVVLSGCLRRNGDTCRAVRDGAILKCSHCTKGCTVSLVTRLAERYGKRALTVIHGSDYSRFLDAVRLTPGNRGAGIIGVACAPGILGAGLRAKARGLAAQCVVLHTSGCEHWRTKEQATSFDLDELERLLSGRARCAG
jgi:uncharacterized protein